LLLNYLDILKIQNTYIANIYYSYKKYCDLFDGLSDYHYHTPFKLHKFLSISFPYSQGIDYFINRHIFTITCGKKYNIFYKIYHLKSRQSGRYKEGVAL
jgi:hypothetical protein